VGHGLKNIEVDQAGATTNVSGMARAGPRAHSGKARPADRKDSGDEHVAPAVTSAWTKHARLAI